MPNPLAGLLGNPMIVVAITGAVLTLFSGIAFFTDFSAGLTSAVTLLAALFDVIAIGWVFGKDGPLSSVFG